MRLHLKRGITDSEKTLSSFYFTCFALGRFEFFLVSDILCACYLCVANRRASSAIIAYE